MVAALIRGSGKIVKGAEGFRCSSAKILGLAAPPDLTLAQALRETFTVHDTISELLESHQAPDSQPPLGDDWFSRPLRQQGVQAAGGYSFLPAGSGHVTFSGGLYGYTNSSSGGGGGSGGSYTSCGCGLCSGGSAYAQPFHGSNAVSSALSYGARSCASCGRVACAPGQTHCVACEVAQAQATVQARRPARPAITGAEALRQLQERKASWDTPDRRTPGPAIMPPDPPQAAPPLMGTQVPHLISSIPYSWTDYATPMVRWALDRVRRSRRS
jgi:hypothetical protein